MLVSFALNNVGEFASIIYIYIYIYIYVKHRICLINNKKNLKSVLTFINLIAFSIETKNLSK
jgi:hypothetical protein